MSVYVDHARQRMLMSHMVADRVEELHEFAYRLGLKREWFQSGSWPHYDIAEVTRRRALQLGATAVSSRDLVLLIRRVYGVRGDQDRPAWRDHFGETVRVWHGDLGTLGLLAMNQGEAWYQYLMNKPFRCPVCNGTGNVPGMFYLSTTGESLGNTTAFTECRSCGGTGVLWR